MNEDFRIYSPVEELLIRILVRLQKDEQEPADEPREEGAQ